jgi:SAM-dependent methyltransferase
MRPHKLNQFTGYMSKAVEFFADHPAGAHILDLPAGNGQVTDALRKIGHRVTSADINERREDYVYADMSKTLPFHDDTFDGVVCLEGIEHMLNPFSLLGELIRVVKIGGHIIVATPNVMNMYSRLQFLLTGTFYQFHPAQLRDMGPDEVGDRFHISPVSYHTLRYLGDYFGARVVKVDADGIKRRILLPVYWLILLLGKLWSRRLFFNRRYQRYRDRNGQIYQHINSRAALFGRSIILVYEKTRPATRVNTDRGTAASSPNDAGLPRLPLRQGAA